jgi:hypothetical protein
MSSTLQMRIALFLIGCIGTRIALALAARSMAPEWLPYAGAVALLPAIGFFTIYLFDLRTTGPEVFGDRIWWNSLRPIHGAMYTGFALLAFQKNPYAWMVLAADAALGLGAFLQHHFFSSL